MNDEPPRHIDLRPQALRLRWTDGDTELDAARLRAGCRCAACRQQALQGHPIRPDPQVHLLDATPAGAYGLQLRFSDGHDRGIYPWSLLRELAHAGAT